MLDRNDEGKYIDVTTDASVSDTGYGLGCCVGITTMMVLFLEQSECHV